MCAHADVWASTSGPEPALLHEAQGILHLWIHCPGLDIFLPAFPDKWLCPQDNPFLKKLMKANTWLKQQAHQKRAAYSKTQQLLTCIWKSGSRYQVEQDPAGARGGTFFASLAQGDTGTWSYQQSFYCSFLSRRKAVILLYFPSH